MTDRIIENASLSDAEAISALFSRSYSQLLKNDYAPDVLARAMPFLSFARPELISSGSYYVVKDASTRVIAAGGWTATRPGAPDEPVKPGWVHVRHFAVDPDFTGQGLGKMLFNHCVRDAKASYGATRFDAYATLSARKFYEKLGFTLIGPIEVSFGSDVTFPSLHMTCDV